MISRTSLPYRRSTKADLASLLAAVQAVIAATPGRLTIRHLFYRLVSGKTIEKDENEYKRLCALLAKWRRQGAIPWEAFVDNLRWYMGRQTFNSMEEALVNAVNTYRRNFWAKSNAYVELWCEKDAVAGLLNEVADPFGVKVFACRGFASLSSLYCAAEIFKGHRKNGRDVYLYYFGDHDPSGVFINRKVEESLREDFFVDVNFVRVAVTPAQIAQYDLPTRPTKTTDSRASTFEGRSVEVDALPLDVFRTMAEDCILNHLDRAEWERLKLVEAAERESLMAALVNLPRGLDPYSLGEVVRSAAENFGFQM